MGIWIGKSVENQISIKEFFSFFEGEYQPGYHFRGESHNFWECVCILEGSLCVSGDERVYNMTEGEIIFHKPLEFHKFYVTSGEKTKLLIFSFTPEGILEDYLKNKVFQLSAMQQDILQVLLSYVRSRKKTDPDTFVEKATAESETAERKTAGSEIKESEVVEFETAKSETAGLKIAEPEIPEPATTGYMSSFSEIPTYSQMVASYVCQLVLSLAEEGTIARTSAAQDALLFRQAVNYMNSMVCAQPSVAEIAGFVGTSEAGLKRIFQKYAGISVHKYFLQLKVKAALRFLEDGCSVTETAYRLGFDSQPYFSAFVKRETGRNPSQILKKSV